MTTKTSEKAPKKQQTPTYLSDMRPQFEPAEIDCGKINLFRYKGGLKSELKARSITPQEAVAIYEDMLVIREMEEMIVKLRSGAYEPIRDFNYRGPTHVSVGQEGTAAGVCSALQLRDNITSTHRGHGESLAKGTVAIRQMTDEQLRMRVPNFKGSKHEDLVEAALEEHVYRTICELFGKDDGYCRGRGGSMHIADFTVGHLGANAIVGGVVPEALNWASQEQFTNHLAGDKACGLPMIFLICNNHYGMTHRSDDEVMGVERMARRASGFASNNMYAEVVNGMNVLAVRDAILRATKLCREGKGPVLIESDCYRYWGHSLSDPRNEYRTKEEEAAWKAIDPVETFK